MKTSSKSEEQSKKPTPFARRDSLKVGAAGAVLADPNLKDIGVYGFARPDPETTLPPEDDSGNARNIAAMREAFRENAE